ncbi:HAD family acid phosphatase [Novosphingobium terrae]|uniref:HAD family acid phosphatase n=1 Tax=Novosphingobium terrae TaxID=2726189 RepID=UPI001980CD44|nr:HAD family acid phosphatase [Novosphingobium terrae]
MRNLLTTALACAIGLVVSSPASADPELLPYTQLDQARTAWQGAQYLYGSGESAAISRASYASLTTYVLSELKGARLHKPLHSVVLAKEADKPGAPCSGDVVCTVEHRSFTPCRPGMKAAVVFDADETLLLNIGAEYAATVNDQGYTTARWERWESEGTQAVAAVPGAVEALATLRAKGVKIIVISNRDATSPTDPTSHKDLSQFTVEALANAKLGSFVHEGKDQNLFLGKEHGDTGTLKDGRRAHVAERYCVIAMVGDQLGDFSDRFSGPKMQPKRAMVDKIALWGRGWFLLPNPVYGSATPYPGDVTDVFPDPQTHWVDKPAQ